jgi:hypothetical protein
LAPRFSHRNRDLSTMLLTWSWGRVGERRPLLRGRCRFACCGNLTSQRSELHHMRVLIKTCVVWIHVDDHHLKIPVSPARERSIRTQIHHSTISDKVVHKNLSEFAVPKWDNGQRLLHISCINTSRVSQALGYPFLVGSHNLHTLAKNHERLVDGPCLP